MCCWWGEGVRARARARANAATHEIVSRLLAARQHLDACFQRYSSTVRMSRRQCLSEHQPIAARAHRVTDRCSCDQGSARRRSRRRKRVVGGSEATQREWQDGPKHLKQRATRSSEGSAVRTLCNWHPPRLPSQPEAPLSDRAPVLCAARELEPRLPPARRATPPRASRRPPRGVPLLGRRGRRSGAPVSRNLETRRIVRTPRRLTACRPRRTSTAS